MAAKKLIWQLKVAFLVITSLSVLNSQKHVRKITIPLKKSLYKPKIFNELVVSSNQQRLQFTLN